MEGIAAKEVATSARTDLIKKQAPLNRKNKIGRSLSGRAFRSTRYLLNTNEATAEGIPNATT